MQAVERNDIFCAPDLVAAVRELNERESFWLLDPKRRTVRVIAVKNIFS